MRKSCALFGSSLLLIGTCLMYVPSGMDPMLFSIGILLLGLECVRPVFTYPYIRKKYINTKTPTPIIRSTRASLRACQERALSRCLRRSTIEFADFVGLASLLLWLRILGVLGVCYKRKPQEFGPVTPIISGYGKLKTPAFGGVVNDG